MNRRNFLLGGTAVIGGAFAFGPNLTSDGAKAAADETFEITKTEAQWQQILAPQQYRILREEGTEYAHSSPLLQEKRAGTFNCAGCELPLYSSKDKYDSGTGWPSFTKALSKAVGTRKDTKFFMVRTEVHCMRCGGHLGHVFDDGPAPTGKRHCINGLSLKFAET
ncbi:MAG: peptide-methionine (R)-S-oxide reductase MsrB [Alphaproteobacteria bacterium]|nr:peptide-methionine (R)-S-oxide reductase MsrB [Alphaproteobacteria bacterium]